MLPRFAVPVVAFLTVLCILLIPPPVAGQTSGQLLGRVVSAESGEPLAGVAVQVLGTQARSISADDGRFLVVAVPAGERTVRFELLGHRALELERVAVRVGRPTQLTVQLSPAPIALPGVRVEAERVQLVEPNVSTTRAVVVQRELRALPIDRMQEAIELTPGVSGGHFRGGRVGQEVHVVDGFEVKNQLGSATESLALELSPSSLEEVEVVTGGFGAQYGSALSGVVSYVTRRGSREQWEARAGASTDAWAPDALYYGFNSVSLSAGGPVSFLGGGSTLFADVLAQGMHDADPHARGLACIEENDVEPALAQRIAELRATAPALYCPYSSSMVPHQRGDKYILFGRLDRPLTPALGLTLTFLRNRAQRELYTPEFRYAANQLGQRLISNLATASVDYSTQREQRGFHVAARGALMRIDRHLGALDPVTFDRSRVAGFGFTDFEFLGEAQVRRPLDEQLAAPAPVPGYRDPGRPLGTPFGPAAEGLFHTEGTPHIANWSRMDMANLDLTGDVLYANGSNVRGGLSAKLYGVESYERTLSYLAGSSPSYARFYPRTLSAFAETHISVDQEINFDVGVRLDAFRSGIDFRADRSDFESPIISAKWRLSANPRIGVSLPIPGSDQTAALRFNFGYVSQPPDFRYFVDSTIGDSLRTDIRRQGNPNLSFERGKSYEISVSKLLTDRAGLALTVFRKELANVVTGGLYIGETGDQIYSTDDRGTVRGAELSLRGRWQRWGVRGSWAWQKATGLTSGLDLDTLNQTLGQDREYPLAFDRRHSLDAAVTYGQAAGDEASPWAMAMTARIESGYPRNRYAAVGDTALRGSAYLPWTSEIGLRISRELGRLPLCDCAVRASLDGRNLLDLENVYAYRGDSGGLGPTMGSVQTLVDQAVAPTGGIPAESSAYAPMADLDRNGLIDSQEFGIARFAAVIDRHDPTLFLGAPRQLRLGLEVSF